MRMVRKRHYHHHQPRVTLILIRYASLSLIPSSRDSLLIHLSNRRWNTVETEVTVGVNHKRSLSLSLSARLVHSRFAGDKGVR